MNENDSIKHTWLTQKIMKWNGEGPNHNNNPQLKPHESEKQQNCTTNPKNK